MATIPLYTKITGKRGLTFYVATERLVRMIHEAEAVIHRRDQIEEGSREGDTPT